MSEHVMKLKLGVFFRQKTSVLPAIFDCSLGDSIPGSSPDSHGLKLVNLVWVCHSLSVKSEGMVIQQLPVITPEVPDDASIHWLEVCSGVWQQECDGEVGVVRRIVLV